MTCLSWNRIGEEQFSGKLCGSQRREIQGKRSTEYEGQNNAGTYVSTNKEEVATFSNITLKHTVNAFCWDTEIIKPTNLFFIFC